MLVKLTGHSLWIKNACSEMAEARPSQHTTQAYNLLPNCGAPLAWKQRTNCSGLAEPGGRGPDIERHLHRHALHGIKAYARAYTSLDPTVYTFTFLPCTTPTAETLQSRPSLCALPLPGNPMTGKPTPDEHFDHAW